MLYVNVNYYEKCELVVLLFTFMTCTDMRLSPFAAAVLVVGDKQ